MVAQSSKSWYIKEKVREERESDSRIEEEAADILSFSPILETRKKKEKGRSELENPS